MSARQVAERVDAALADHRPKSWNSLRGPALVQALEEFEVRVGVRMPDSFRYLQLNTAGVELTERVSPFAGSVALRHTLLSYFDGSIERLYDRELRALYLRGTESSEFEDWLTKLVPCADEGDNDLICLDFAFDPVDPPIVVVHYERGGWPEAYGQRVSYVADNFLQHLEFEVVAENGSYTTATSRVTQRMVDWYEHRDAMLAPSEQRPPWPRSSDINWPAR